MNAQLGPRPLLENLFEGAGSARQRDEAVGQVGHHDFPLMHRVDDVERRQPLKGDLPFDQGVGHDAGRPAARNQHGIGNRTHESDPSTPIDKLDFLLDKNLSGRPGGVHKSWVVPGTGTAEYANPHAMVTFATASLRLESRDKLIEGSDARVIRGDEPKIHRA